MKSTVAIEEISRYYDYQDKAEAKLRRKLAKMKLKHAKALRQKRNAVMDPDNLEEELVPVIVYGNLYFMKVVDYHVATTLWATEGSYTAPTYHVKFFTLAVMVDNRATLPTLASHFYIDRVNAWAEAGGNKLKEVVENNQLIQTCLEAEAELMPSSESDVDL